MENAIKLFTLLPKGGTILLWVVEKAKLLGIKGSVLNRLENVMLVELLTREFLWPKSMDSMSVTSTIGTLKATDVFLAEKNLNKILKQLNLNGLAKELGITKEGVQRLIWLLGDVQNIRNGSGIYSSETILLVKNALQKERILKQTITPLDSQLLWMKKESLPTNRRWRVNDYGIKTMDGHFVGSVIEVTA